MFVSLCKRGECNCVFKVTGRSNNKNVYEYEKSKIHNSHKLIIAVEALTNNWNSFIVALAIYTH